MTDYIKREDAIEAIAQREASGVLTVSGVYPIISDIPAADVVAVVRCKDCLHGSWCEDVLWCNITDEPMTENDFCSKGDRI